MAFILSGVDDITNTFHIMVEHPSLVKIVLNYKECFHNKTMYENRVKNISQYLWMKHRVLHIFFIPLCLIELNTNSTSINVADDYEECFVDDIYVYDAFGLCPKDIRSDGILRKFSLRHESNKLHPVNSKQSTNLEFQNIVTVNDDDGSDDDVAKSFNDFLRNNGKRFNLHGMIMNVSFFPTTMAYLKAETKLFSKTSTDEHLLDPLSTSPDIYFGADVEILKLFASRKINFTPHVINPSDKQYYGFRVIHLNEIILLSKLFLIFILVFFPSFMYHLYIFAMIYFQWQQENGSYAGALGDLLYQRTEFIMNAFFIKDYETRDLQFTSAVYNDEMCVGKYLFIIRCMAYTLFNTNLSLRSTCRSGTECRSGTYICLNFVVVLLYT